MLSQIARTVTYTFLKNAIKTQIKGKFNIEMAGYLTVYKGELYIIFIYNYLFYFVKYSNSPFLNMQDTRGSLKTIKPKIIPP